MIPCIYVPAGAPEDWKVFLADPDKQWRDGFSAKCLAYAWQHSDGFPQAVKAAFKRSDFPVFQDIEPLFALPEHKVRLPGGGAASQNDLFVLAKGNGRLISIMVEGKVSESFGSPVSKWFKDPSEGRRKRLSYLCGLMNLDQDRVQNIRYQLLHRTASALIEARRFTASHAVMLVHSFSETRERFSDYKDFAGLFGVEAQHDRIVHAGSLEGVNLYFGWVCDKIPDRQSSTKRGVVTARKCPRCGHHEIGISDTKGNYTSLKSGMQVHIIDGNRS